MKFGALSVAPRREKSDRWIYGSGNNMAAQNEETSKEAAIVMSFWPHDWDFGFHQRFFFFLSLFLHHGSKINICHV